MKRLPRSCLLVAAALTAAVHAAEPSALPVVPPEITAMLLEHRGQWRAEGWIIEGEKRTPVGATWECKAAVNGVGNLCTWNHEWTDRPHDAALDIMGYDPKAKVLRMQRVNDTGIMGPGAQVTVIGNTMTMVRESTSESGKPRVMRNEIVVTKPGEWRQLITFDEDGKRVMEWRLTQRRFASATDVVAPAALSKTDVPAEIVAWLDGLRGTWRSEGVMINGEERTKAFATWECAAAVNGFGNVCTWHHEWTNRPADSALDVMGYDPGKKMLSTARVSDTGLLEEPTTISVHGNTVSGTRQMIENGKPAVLHNDVVVKSGDERAQRMWVEVDGKVAREFIITHRRVK
jgi:hypothetical protein